MIIITQSQKHDFFRHRGEKNANKSTHSKKVN